MAYQHKSTRGDVIDLPVGKVVCVGANYADHIKEMGTVISDDDPAVLFMKPDAALVDASQPFAIPTDQGECHNELELALLISSPLTKATPDQCMESIWGVGLALDLTLREVQREMKRKGRPWERAKSFDGSCPTTAFIPVSEIADLQVLPLTLTVNDAVRQDGNSRQMIRPIAALLAEITQSFSLRPGDIVLTGTPEGVGPLSPGDTLRLQMGEHLMVETSVSGL